MVNSNVEYARTIQQALKSGLLDEVIRLSRDLCGEDEYVTWISEKAKIFGLRNSEERLRNKLDSQGLLKVIAYGWRGQLENQFDGDAEDLSSHAHFLLKNLRNVNAHDSDDNLARLSNSSLLPAVASVAIDLLVAFNTNESRSSADDIRKYSDELNVRASDETQSETPIIVADSLQASTPTPEYTEPTSETMPSRNVASTETVEKGDQSRDHINRRYSLDNYSESPAQVVDRELPRLRDLALEEDSSKKKRPRNFIKPKRSKHNFRKKKRPYNSIPTAKRRNPPNAMRPGQPKLSKFFNSNNQQSTNQKDVPASAGEQSISIPFYWVCAVILLICVFLLFVLVQQENILVVPVLVIILGFVFFLLKRLLQHKEEMRRMEIESQRKTIFQRVRGFFSR